MRLHGREKLSIDGTIGEEKKGDRKGLRRWRDVCAREAWEGLAESGCGDTWTAASQLVLDATSDHCHSQPPPLHILILA